MLVSEITPIILSFNEGPNIERTLSALSWAKQVVLLDSGSSDNTVQIAAQSHPNVRVITRPFDSFAGQCNFGLGQVTTEWVLSLDADYILSPELSGEIPGLNPGPDVAGYAVDFRYAIYGRSLRASVYPPRTVLYRKDKARYRDEGHGHRVVIDGQVEKLAGKIFHDDRKPLSHWIQAQDRYAILEARHLLETGNRKPEAGDVAPSLSIQDRLRRRIFFAAPAMFLYLLFGKGLILDGWPGWMYVAQRTVAELLLSMRLLIEREALEVESRK